MPLRHVSLTSSAFQIKENKLRGACGGQGSTLVRLRSQDSLLSASNFGDRGDAVSIYYVAPNGKMAEKLGRI
jgi:hypothetical protein